MSHTKIASFRNFPIYKQRWLQFSEIDGYCSYKPRCITIGAHCRGKRQLDTLIHEMLHAAFPKLTEKQVFNAARDIAETLWKMGWRK